jgi:hypothetical protein
MSLNINDLHPLAEKKPFFPFLFPSPTPVYANGHLLPFRPAMSSTPFYVRTLNTITNAFHTDQETLLAVLLTVVLVLVTGKTARSRRVLLSVPSLLFLKQTQAE